MSDLPVNPTKENANFVQSVEARAGQDIGKNSISARIQSLADRHEKENLPQKEVYQVTPEGLTNEQTDYKYITDSDLDYIERQPHPAVDPKRGRP